MEPLATTVTNHGAISPLLAVAVPTILLSSENETATDFFETLPSERAKAKRMTIESFRSCPSRSGWKYALATVRVLIRCWLIGRILTKLDLEQV
jgi:hypothetical protein